MRRWLFLVSLGTGLCTGCARPSTSEPSQYPLATRALGPAPAVVPVGRVAPTSAADETTQPTDPTPAAPPASEGPAPAPELSQQQIEERLLDGTLGCLSVGKPNGGALVNGVQLTRSDYFEPVDPNSAWGTDETLSYLEAAARKVHEAFPDSPRLWVGDIS